MVWFSCPTLNVTNVFVLVNTCCSSSELCLNIVWVVYSHQESTTWVDQRKHMCYTCVLLRLHVLGGMIKLSHAKRDAWVNGKARFYITKTPPHVESAAKAAFVLPCTLVPLVRSCKTKFYCLPVGSSKAPLLLNSWDSCAKERRQGLNTGTFTRENQSIYCSDMVCWFCLTQLLKFYTRKPIHLLQPNVWMIFFDSTLESLQRKPFRSLWSNVGIFFENTSNDFYNLSIDTAPL